MSKKVGHLLVVEDEEDEIPRSGPLIVEDDEDDECIVFPSKRTSSAPESPKKTVPLKLEQAPLKPAKANPKKRQAPEPATAPSSKRLKVNTLVTEEPSIPHQNYNEDLTKILAGAC